jgi:S-adenosylmethionine hydrolase
VMVKKSVVTKFKFVTTFSQVGKDKRIIWIPKRYHLEIAKFLTNRSGCRQMMIDYELA